MPLLALATSFAIDRSDRQGSTIASPTTAFSSRRLFIDPSSTSVKFGKASLTVTPLLPRDNAYVGDYQLKVVPYLFKSEKGRLFLAAPPDSYRQFLSGSAIDFTGTATNKKDGKIKMVKGKITPVSGDRGHVTFSVMTLMERWYSIPLTTWHRS
jgi:hypothetical protein